MDTDRRASAEQSVKDWEVYMQKLREKNASENRPPVSGDYSQTESHKTYWCGYYLTR